MRLFRVVLLAVLMGLLAAPTAGASEAAEEAEGEAFSAIDHTIDTAYIELPLVGQVELPRIFLLRSEAGDWSIEAFGSTAQTLASGQYGLRHETEEGMEVIRSEEAISEAVAHHEHLHAEVVPLGGAEILVDLSVTKHLVYALLAAFLTLVAFIGLARRYRRGIGRESAPKGLTHNILESMIVFVRDEIAKPALGPHYKKFLPFLLTAFFFILVSNLFALIPYTAAATANISVTLVLAFFTFIIGQLYASKDHWKEIFTGPPGAPFLIRIILIPIEIVGLLVRHLALAIRLFANMMAGTLVIFSLIGLIFIFNNIFGATVAWFSAPVSVALTLFILTVKLLVAFIQAYVFTILSAIFIGLAVEEHHREEALPEEPEDDTGELTPTVSGDGAAERRTRVETEPVPAAT